MNIVRSSTLALALPVLATLPATLADADPAMPVVVSSSAQAAPLTVSSDTLALLRPALRALPDPRNGFVLERMPETKVVLGLQIIQDKMYATVRGGAPIDVTPKIVMGPKPVVPLYQTLPRLILPKPVVPHVTPQPAPQR